MAFCCCIDQNQCLPQYYSLSQQGLINPDNGWNIPNKDPNNIPRNLPISIDFKFEDSENCGGMNNNYQWGTINGCITLSSQSTIEFSVSGLTEREDDQFDISNIWFELSPDYWSQLVIITATLEGLGCEMGFRSDTKVLQLPAGTYRYQLNSYTNDGRFHKNMIHSFSIKKI